MRLFKLSLPSGWDLLAYLYPSWVWGFHRVPDASYYGIYFGRFSLVLKNWDRDICPHGVVPSASCISCNSAYADAYWASCLNCDANGIGWGWFKGGTCLRCKRSDVEGERK